MGKQTDGRAGARGPRWAVTVSVENLIELSQKWRHAAVLRRSPRTRSRAAPSKRDLHTVHSHGRHTYLAERKVRSAFGGPTCSTRRRVGCIGEFWSSAMISGSAVSPEANGGCAHSKGRNGNGMPSNSLPSPVKAWSAMKAERADREPRMIDHTQNEYKFGSNI